MQYYFKLQYRRYSRILSEQGVYPFLGFLGVGIGFVALSLLIFYKLEWPQWIYATLGVLLIAQLSQERRTNLLRLVYDNPPYRRIRLLENVGASIPFALVLCYYGHYLIGLGVVLFSIALALTSFRNRTFVVLPTPFRKYPFEFIRDFIIGDRLDKIFQ